MADFSVGDRVVLRKGLPQRADHVGRVVEIDGEEIWVQWSGPEAPAEPSKYARGALEHA